MAQFEPELVPRAMECPQCGKPVIAQPKGFVVDPGDLESGVDPTERSTLYACEAQHPILTVESAWGSQWNAEGLVSVLFDDDPYRMYRPRTVWP
jgi:hypothetical protein